MLKSKANNKKLNDNDPKLNGNDPKLNGNDSKLNKTNCNNGTNSPGKVPKNNQNSRLKAFRRTFTKPFTNKFERTGKGATKQVTCHGSMKQYCVKGDNVFLRKIHFIRNDVSKMLMITVDNKSHQTDTYNVLFTKDICPYTFKDSNAFIMKVYDGDKKLKNMTFQSLKKEDKEQWIIKFGLNVENLLEILKSCTDEIERRRFQLGIKKRSEGKCKTKIECDILIILINAIEQNRTLDFTNEEKWSIGCLERLIQVLFNEISEPLINFNCQINLRDLSDTSKFAVANECQLILNSIPSINQKMLTVILGHMERLSKYYLIIMSSSKNVLPHIRENICKRLAPILFRVQQSYENDRILSRCCDVLYQLMIYNNATKTNEGR